MVAAASVRKNRRGNCGVSWPVLYYSGLSAFPIKIISPRYFSLSSSVILDYFNVLSDPFPCCGF